MNDGYWSGQVRMLWEGQADLSCELAYNYAFRQILSGLSYGQPEYLTFASPKYELKSKTFALLNPFSLLVWLLIIGLMLFMPVLLYIFGLKYHSAAKMSPLNIFNELEWFSFSIFMGEVKVSNLRIVPYT